MQENGKGKPSTEKTRQYWRKTGKAAHAAPKWVKLRTSLKSAFPPYYQTTPDTFATQFSDAIQQLDALKHDQDGPAILGSNYGLTPDYSEVTEAVMEEEPQTLQEVIDDSVALFEGVVNVSHPLHMPNVLPAPNKASLIAATMANIYNPNIIEGEFAWHVEHAEMESVAMLAKLIGYRPHQAGGFYTYGGSGCYLYAVKYALTHVLGEETRCKGIRTDGKIFVSQQGHYAKMNATDWLGLGMNNIVDINTNDETNAMDTEHLEQEMKKCYDEGTPIICVICTMGTTDALAIDPADEVRTLIDKYPNRAPYKKALLYCDAVIGWSFLTFGNYNFDTNPLEFSERALQGIQETTQLVSMVKHADAVGIDFHKSGWAQYASSCIVFKDLNHFRELMTRPGSAYLHARSPYNPGLYTLEVSRSGSAAMAGWATLKYFGLKGFQTIIGGVLEVQEYLRARLEEEEDMVCVNETGHGYVTLLRIYERGVNAEGQYELEVSDPAYKADLVSNNDLQKRIANALWYHLRTGEKYEGYYGAFTNFTSGFRTTDYNDDMNDPEAVIYALKTYPMNVNVTSQTMDTIIDMIKLARDRVVGGFVPPEAEWLVCKPYSEVIGSKPCGEADEEKKRTRINDMVSGISLGRKRPVRRTRK